MSEKKCLNCGSDEGTMLKEFDNEKSYSWGELAEMTEVCVSCGEDMPDEEASYEQAQIDSLDDSGDYGYNLKITLESAETKWMRISREQLAQIRAILE